jgi:hypothetical protein
MNRTSLVLVCSFIFYLRQVSRNPLKMEQGTPHFHTRQFFNLG